MIFDCRHIFSSRCHAFDCQSDADAMLPPCHAITRLFRCHAAIIFAIIAAITARCC